jgi:hypothetical protein
MSALGRAPTFRGRRLGFLVAAFLLACGGDDDSSVDGDKTMAELSDAELMDFCEWSLHLVPEEEASRFTCYSTAIRVSDGDEEACQEVADSCLEDTEEQDDIDPADFVCREDVDLPDCASEVTVAEVERCYQAVADQLVDLFAEVSCQTQPEDLPDDLNGDTLPAPPDCETIVEECPELLEGDDDDS